MKYHKVFIILIIMLMVTACTSQSITEDNIGNENQNKIVSTKSNLEKESEDEKLKEKTFKEDDPPKVVEHKTDEIHIEDNENNPLAWQDEVTLGKNDPSKVFFWQKSILQPESKHPVPHVYIKNGSPVVFQYHKNENITNSLVYREVYQDFSSTYYSGTHTYFRDEKSFNELKNSDDLYYINFYQQAKSVIKAKEVELLINEQYQEFDFDNNIIAYSKRGDLQLTIIRENTRYQLTDTPVRDIRVIGNRVFFFSDDGNLGVVDGKNEIIFHKDIPERYQVLNNDIYYVSKENKLYQYNILNSQTKLIEENVEKLICDNQFIYFFKTNNGKYPPIDQIYRYNSSLDTSEFITVAEFWYINTFFVYNNKIYVGWMDECFVSYVRCFEPNKNIFTKNVLYENDKHLIFYVDYIQYEGGHGEAFIYDKVKQKIIYRFDDWLRPDTKIIGNYIFFESNTSNIYRFNIDTLDVQQVYDGPEYDMVSRIYYALMDESNIIVSQPNYLTGRLEFINYYINTESNNKTLLDFTGSIITLFDSKLYFADDAIYYYQLNSKCTAKVSSVFDNRLKNEDFKLVFEDDTYIYLRYHLNRNSVLIKVNKHDDSIEELLNDDDSSYQWLYYNNNMYYQKGNQIIKFNFADYSKTVLVNDCYRFFTDIIYKDNKVFLLYNIENYRSVLLELE